MVYELVIGGFMIGWRWLNKLGVRCSVFYVRCSRLDKLIDVGAGAGAGAGGGPGSRW